MVKVINNHVQNLQAKFDAYLTDSHDKIIVMKDIRVIVELLSRANEHFPSFYIFIFTDGDYV